MFLHKAKLKAMKELHPDTSGQAPRRHERAAVRASRLQLFKRTRWRRSAPT